MSDYDPEDYVTKYWRLRREAEEAAAAAEKEQGDGKTEGCEGQGEAETGKRKQSGHRKLSRKEPEQQPEEDRGED